MPALKKDNTNDSRPISKAAKRLVKRAEFTPPRSPSPPASRSATPADLPALPPSPAVSPSPSTASLKSAIIAPSTETTTAKDSPDIVEEQHPPKPSEEDLKVEEDDPVALKPAPSNDAQVRNEAEPSSGEGFQAPSKPNEDIEEPPATAAEPSAMSEDPVAVSGVEAAASSELQSGIEDAEKEDSESITDAFTDAPSPEQVSEHSLGEPVGSVTANGAADSEQPGNPVSEAPPSEAAAKEPGDGVQDRALTEDRGENQKPPFPATQSTDMPRTPLASVPSPAPQSPAQYQHSGTAHPFASVPTSGYQPQYYPHATPTPYHYTMGQGQGLPNGMMNGMLHGPGYPLQPQYATPPHQASYRGFSSPLGPFGGTPPMQQPIPVGSRGGAVDGTAFEDDAGDLLSRISSAIPDLHLLLSRYNETRGQLGVREELIRRAETQQAELMKRKEDYIDTLIKQLEHATKQHESLTKAHETESNKLRLQIGNLEEKIKELEDRVSEAELSKKELQEAISTLETEKASLEQEKTNIEAAFAEEKERLLKDFEDSKTKAKEEFDAEKVALTVESEKKQKELEDLFETQKSEMNDEHAKEKDAIHADFAKQKDELEADFSKKVDGLRADFDQQKGALDDKLSNVQQDLEEAIKREQQNVETWTKEKNSMTKEWDEERTRATRDMEEQRQSLTAEKEKEKGDIQRFWLELQAELTNKWEAEKEGLEKEIASLKREREEDRQNFDRVIGELKSVTENLDTEKNRLQKMVECFGEITDLKSKGDAYYIDAFTQLSKQILDLSNTHFQHLPTPPAAEHIARVPSSLPPFLDNTPASRHVRSAYIAHVISNLLTIRVFTPFLFSLGRRYDKADGLFAALSNQLRGKSTRKEAVWRQHTLVAAFTTTDAKERINAAAGAVVEEIVGELKHWTEPSEEEAIQVAVRRIVKLAAETWRFARLEREMITARMPAIDEETEEDKIDGLWPAHTFDTSTYQTPLPEPGEGVSPSRPKLLLRLIPVIQREPAHPDFQLTEKEKEDKGCIYSPGLALYDNAVPLRARREELTPTDSTVPTEPPPTSAGEEPAPAAAESPAPPASAPPGPIEQEPSPPTDQGTPAPEPIPNSPCPSPTRPTSPLYPITDETDAKSNRSVRGPPLSRRSTFTASTLPSASGDSRSTGNSIHTLDRRSSGGISTRSAAIKGLYRRPGSWGAEGLAIQRVRSGEGGGRKGVESGRMSEMVGSRESLGSGSGAAEGD